MRRALAREATCCDDAVPAHSTTSAIASMRFILLFTISYNKHNAGCNIILHPALFFLQIIGLPNNPQPFYFTTLRRWVAVPLSVVMVT